MPEKCPQEYIDFAEKLATLAGKIVKSYFRASAKVTEKSDHSLVTEADVAVEKAIRAAIRKAYPHHGIIGEELGTLKSKSGYTWVIDPIDGTSSFVIGRPTFGTLIALLYNDKPILGIIDQPISKERWIGANGKATFNSKKIKTRPCTDISKAIVCTTSKDLFGNYLDKFEKVRTKANQTIYGGDCYSYGLTASGFVDIVIESGLNVYDFCALAPIVEGAGGVFSDWEGNPITAKSKGNVIAVGDNKLHPKLVKLLS